MPRPHTQALTRDSGQHLYFVTVCLINQKKILGNKDHPTVSMPPIALALKKST